MFVPAGGLRLGSGLVLNRFQEALVTYNLKGRRGRSFHIHPLEAINDGRQLAVGLDHQHGGMRDNINMDPQRGSDGKRTRDLMPCAYIQFLRIDGTALTDPIKDAEDIDGPIGQVISRLDQKLQAHIQTAVDVAAGPLEIRRIERWKFFTTLKIYLKSN